MPILNVAIEPPLQPLPDEQLRLASAITNDEVRLDIAAEGLWSSHNRVIFDVKVFNPFARAKSGYPRAAVYRRHERVKIRAYEQRLLEIHGAWIIYNSCAIREEIVEQSAFDIGSRTSNLPFLSRLQSME